jgi:hypothetical protein
LACVCSQALAIALMIRFHGSVVPVLDTSHRAATTTEIDLADVPIRQRKKLREGRP